MTEQEMALIASKVSNNASLWIALSGSIGVVVGALITMSGNLLIVWLKDKSQKKSDEIRQEILTHLLESKDYKWRNLTTLAAVVGCSEEDTKNHLILINARGSEKNDGKWGLISRNPLNIKDQ